MQFFKILAYASRFTADIFHTYSMIVLLKKIKTTRSCSGLSLKTQFLYLLIFLTRYVDLFYLHINSFLRIYNFIMKIIYLALQSYILILARQKYFYTYDKRSDSFKIIYLILPSFILAIFLQRSARSLSLKLTEFSWTFSILLECVAILPQLVLLQETGEAEVLTSKYIFCLGVYRMMYVFGWIFKKMGGSKVDVLLFACGIVQTLLYADFFVLYYRYVFKREKEDVIPH